VSTILGGHYPAPSRRGRAVRPDGYGRQSKDLEPDEIKQRLARIAGRDLGAEHDHAPGQGARDIRGRLADVLRKTRAEDQEREKARQKERELGQDEERKRQRELDRDLGWEL
jgi:hypothetical protein